MFQRLKNWSNQLWVIGRRSNYAYLRFYPNPGVMAPWFGNKSVVWTWHDGFFTRPRGTIWRPAKNK